MKLRGLFIAVAALAVSAGPALSADEWGIEHEEVVRFEAKVVDLLCEIAGDCPPACGAGKRQLGLLKEDGTLIPVVKNFDPFAGAVNDLKDFCGKQIVADGLLIADPLMPMMVLQFKREAPDGKWSRANWFVRDWAEANGVARDSEQAGQWFYNDKTIKAKIDVGGPFGIPGLKPDNE